MPRINFTTRQHFEKYRDLSFRLGVVVGKIEGRQGYFLGREPERWVALWRKDSALNNVPLVEWDRQSVFLRVRNVELSMAELVSMYKHCAIYQIVLAVPYFVRDFEEELRLVRLYHPFDGEIPPGGLR